MNWENEYKKMKTDNTYLRGMNEVNIKRIIAKDKEMAECVANFEERIIAKDKEVEFLMKALRDMNNFIKNLINRELK
jgi:hypothetical protein